MSYESTTIAEILPKLNTTYFLPALQREFVWSSDQICALFDSLMRRYPISAFLVWQVPDEARDDVDAYEFLTKVSQTGNRAQLARKNGFRELTFVLDGQQRLTSLLVGIQGSYTERKSKSGKGARTQVSKKLFLDLMHDGTVADMEGEIFYKFQFFDYAPMVEKESYWFEVGRILNVHGSSGIDEMIERQIKAIRDIRSVNSQKAVLIENSLRRLHKSLWEDRVISYHAETDSDPERILEIFVRANSGGMELSKSDLLLSTLTLHWRNENAREELNGFVDEINTQLTGKNRFSKDFVMKACLVLLDLPVAYRVTSFNKETCSRIRERWDDIRDALRRAVDGSNVFGIDENNLTSANALIPIAYYLFQYPDLNLSGESRDDVNNALPIRRWLISTLLYGVFGGSSDAMLARLREVLKQNRKQVPDFPAKQLDDAIRNAGRISGSSEEAVDQVMEFTYNDYDIFLALSLLYKDRNWGTIKHQIDHIFPQSNFKRGVPEHIKTLRDDYANLSLIVGVDNAGKQDKPLDEWLRSRSPEYLERHFIPRDPKLWLLDNFEQFIIERRRLLRAHLKTVFATPELM